MNEAVIVSTARTPIGKHIKELLITHMEQPWLDMLLKKL